MRYYLSIGSNLGKREENINAAVRLLNETAGKVLRISSFYYSEPWGFVSDNLFCNIALCLESDLSPESLLAATQAIERQLGRTEKTEGGHYCDRLIDIDLLQCFDTSVSENAPTLSEGKEIIVDTPTLTLPHPLMHQRDFVLIPLAEIVSA